MPDQIALIDLARQQEMIRDRIDAAVSRVLDHGSYILGPEVTELESKLAAFSGAEFAVTCANGTDALSLILMAEAVRAGDAILVPSFTFVATAEIIPSTGATPIFVDVDPETFTMCTKSLEIGLDKARSLGLTPRAIIAVDLFGLPSNYPALREIADREGMVLIADAAQSFGAQLDGKRVGTLADYTTTSFFPAKPLGCYGDGGAIMLSDPGKDALLRSLRFHGKGEQKYDNVRLGLNSRLDTLQAAILIEKLAIFENEIEARNVVASQYAEAFSGHVRCQKVPDGFKSVWAQFTLVAEDRSNIQEECGKAGIATAIYYPLPMHLQSGYIAFPLAEERLPVSEQLSESVISIPMHPYLTAEQIQRVVETVVSACK